jgi:hypothetical protein
VSNTIHKQEHAVLSRLECLQAGADLAEDAASLTPGAEASFDATLTGPTDPLPLPVLTSIPGASVMTAVSSAGRTSATLAITGVLVALVNNWHAHFGSVVTR